MNNYYDDPLPVKPGTYYPKHQLHQKTSRQKPTRAVSKTGEINIHLDSSQRFKVSNYFIDLVEARWRWTIINFVLAFIFNWLFFGLIYYGISYSHEDFKAENMHQNYTEFTPCIRNTYGFTSTFLFSIEIHTTVAYGRRAITLECPHTIIAMCLQCMVSSIFQSIMVGILFVKLTCPRSRTQTILFSKYAALSLRNEIYCLIFRVGDIRKSRILNIKPQAFIIKQNSDNEYLDEERQIELKVEIDECESTFFLWPVTIVHLINQSSPLYGISAADLLCRRIEILVVFEGIIESTGQPVQARSSYTEHDILWGHRFLPMVGYNVDKLMYVVDFSKLSEITQVDTPLCSAKEYDSLLSTIIDTYG
ncbi:G protein-activated inward rectifier potassium channel 4-like [Epargyreus clarus]|uniref:G protein-activated inward rectifier potassium channel 4-like n=1 Tax=Epargyreus clarus TaxID=520877 RepID=UPI003C2F063B